MSRFAFVLAVSFLACGLSSGLHAQCSNATITGAFQVALNRVPTATECNANRYAGGAYTSTTTLVPLVKASVVCSDPWIAQAYYQLNLPLNGHSALALDPSGPGSTTNQCNYSIYGSWTTFAQLKTLVQQHSSPVVTPVAPTLAKAAIAGPSLMAAGGTATVIWSNGPAAAANCSAGLQLQASGGAYGTNYGLVNVPNNYVSAGSVSFTIGAGLTSAQNITLHLFDPCHTAVVSNEYPASIAVQRLVTAVTSTITVRGLDPNGCLIDVSGNKLAANENCGMYWLNANGINAPRTYTVVFNGKSVIAPPPTSINNGGLLMASGGSPAKIVGPSAGTWQITGIVAAGGGNIVAAGGGNIVAAGGGNIIINGGSNVVAAGGGNIVAAGGGNLQFVDPLSAARTLNLLYNGASVISNDGGSLLSTLLNLPAIRSFVGNNASTLGH